MSTSVNANSFEQWRTVARHLILQNIPPHELHWNRLDSPNDLLSDTHLVPSCPGVQSSSKTIKITRQLLSLLQLAACHRSTDRWAFLYKVLWRWQQNEKVVLSAADPDGARFHAIVKTIRREIHKMNAFVRFRENNNPECKDTPRFVAWFEPNHDVLGYVAEHFAKRMGRVTWMIATPDGSAYWDGDALQMNDTPIRSIPDIADAGEALWLAYYRSIFNPARLNNNAMELHMPVRYWKNLPEAKLIPELISGATSGQQKSGQLAKLSFFAGKTINAGTQHAPLKVNR